MILISTCLEIPPIFYVFLCRQFVGLFSVLASILNNYSGYLQSAERLKDFKFKGDTDKVSTLVTIIYIRTKIK